MNKLQSMISEIRARAPVKEYDPKSYISCWTEKDVLEGQIVDALVIILRTRGCTWSQTGGCSMCGYINDCGKAKITSDDINNQFEKALNKFSGKTHDIVKIFTSGSFIDNDEIEEKVQLEILIKLKSQTKKVIIESRPDFIVDKKLDAIQSTFKNIEN